MITIRRILVPTDFSPCAGLALSAGADFARQFGARLHLLHVAPKSGSKTLNGGDGKAIGIVAADHRQHNVPKSMRAAIEQNVPFPVTMDTDCRRANRPGPEILLYAEELRVDLIVLGARGDSGIKKGAIGSVAEEVVANADCPVLTVPLNSPANVLTQCRRILVPIDFSGHARLALLHAKHIAWRAGARVALLHVISPPYRMHRGSDPSWILHGRDAQENSAAMELRRFNEETGGPEVTVDCEVVVDHSIQSINQFVKDCSVDLVVSAAVGHWGLRRFRLAHVAQRLVCLSPCPVLTVKPFGTTLVATARGCMRRASAPEDEDGPGQQPPSVYPSRCAYERRN